MLTKEQLEALLGRPLTSVEDTNYETYIDIAEKRLSNLVCFKLSKESATRKYDTRYGYRTAYVDPFTVVTEVQVNDEVRTGWTKKQNDDYQGDWFNIIEFDEPLCGERIEVTGNFGFSKLPQDLAALLASIFGIQATENGQKVQRKKIEDYEVTYQNAVTSSFDQLVTTHADTITKYAQCERAVSHGFPIRPLYHY